VKPVTDFSPTPPALSLSAEELAEGVRLRDAVREDGGVFAQETAEYDDWLIAHAARLFASLLAALNPEPQTR
jgi:hypothetical protein